MYLRKIKCPRHFLLKPGCSPWKMGLNPLMKDVPEWAFRKWPTLRRYIPVKDKHGNKVRDNTSFYQPEISATFAVKHIYDPLNPICKLGCKGRCLEGVPNVGATIGRRIPTEKLVV